MGSLGPAPFPPSLYAATAKGVVERSSLVGTVDADVCIVGGGFTGLSTALHLAEQGVSVVVLEAERAGWGASGRNGGQIHTGQRRDPFWMAERIGADLARRLWDLAEDAKQLVRDLVERHNIQCDLRSGLIHAIHRERDVSEEREHADRIRSDYGYTDFEWLDRDQINAALGTESFFGGWRDFGGGHLHPLNFALGLARAAESAGARIFERSKVIGIRDGRKKTVETAAGAVKADQVVLAGNGYMHGLMPDIESRALPINNFILATEPLGKDRADGLIAGRECASDTRFVVNYWRIDAENRMVFGGGENVSETFPPDIGRFVRPHMLKLYPALADCRIDYAWGGTLAITANRVPYIRRVSPGTYAALGYSGQGVALAPHTGKLIADAIAKGDGTLDAYLGLPMPAFPGGRMFRTPLLWAALQWYGLQDKL